MGHILGQLALIIGAVSAGSWLVSVIENRARRHCANAASEATPPAWWGREIVKAGLRRKAADIKKQIRSLDSIKG